MPIRYYTTYALIIIFGASFFVLGLLGHLPHIPCLFRELTGSPCPSCGVTTSIILAMRGEFKASFGTHPFGIFFILSIAATTALSVYGLAVKSRLEWLFNKYTRAVAIALLLLYIARWLFGLIT